MFKDVKLHHIMATPKVGWVIALGKKGWEIDPVMFYNQGIALMYTSTSSEKMDGSYVQVEPAGRVAVGEFKGAYQFITDAEFKVLEEKQFESLEYVMSHLEEIIDLEFGVFCTEGFGHYHQGAHCHCMY